jgi:hypothetical protein
MTERERSSTCRSLSGLPARTGFSPAAASPIVVPQVMEETTADDGRHAEVLKEEGKKKR